MLGIYNHIHEVTNRKLNRVITQARELSLKLNDYKQFRRRVTLGQQLVAERSRYRVPQDKGYLKFGPEAFGGTGSMVEIGRAVFARSGPEVLAGLNLTKGKSYLVNILTYEDLDAYPAIWDFVLNQELLGTLSGYYGFLPELCSIALMLSPANDTKKGSQEAHFDLRDSKHIKVFVPVADIGEENGPFEFIPRDVSAMVRQKLGVLKHVDDDTLFSFVPHSQFIKLTAKAGEGLIVDTTNCLHFGGRVRQGYRLMWFLHYGTFWQNNRQEVKNPLKDLRLEHMGERTRFTRDEASSLVLSVPTQ